VLTAEEVSNLLKELSDPWRTAVYVAITTGLRVSELLGLKWSDIDFVEGEINLHRGIVRQNVGEMKTEASRKPIPLDSQLAEVFTLWRSVCPYNQEADDIFASPDMDGRQPYWPTAGMEKHIRTAAKKAGITKQIGWHTLRHTFGTLIKSQGADVATTQALMRHANASITMDRYVQAISEAKREAQSRIVQAIPYPNEPRLLTDVSVSV
jgi:integrase